MFKRFTSLLAALTFSLFLFTATASADFQFPRFWEEKDATTIQPVEYSSGNTYDVELVNLTVTGVFTFGGAMGGDLDMAGFDILRVDHIFGDTNLPVNIGDAGSTSNGLASDDSLFISDELEVDGNVFHDASTTYRGVTVHRDNVGFVLGNGSDSILDWSTAQAVNTSIWGLGATSKSIIFTDVANRDKDHDVAAQGTPTVFVFSDTDPDVANDESLSLTHDVTDGRIQTGSGNLSIGSGSTSHSLVTPGDVFISEKLEVDGILSADGQLQVESSSLHKNNVELRFGAATNAMLDWSTNQATSNTMVFGLGDTPKSFIFTTKANRDKDHDLAAQSDPTVCIYSDTDPDTANDEYTCLTHDQTDAVISTGSGNINLAPSSGVVLLNDASGQLNVRTNLANGFLVEQESTGNDLFSVSGSSGQIEFNKVGGFTTVASSPDLGARMNIGSLTTITVPLALTGITSFTGNYFEINTIGDLGGDIFRIGNDGAVIAMGPSVFTPSSDQALVAGDTLTVTSGIMRVAGSGGAVTLTSTPHITDAIDGTCVKIQGTSDTNTLTFQDESSLANSGMKLNGGFDVVVGQGDIFEVCYDLGDDLWYQATPLNNN